MSSQPLHSVAALPPHASLMSKRLSYAMKAPANNKKINLTGIDRIQKIAVLINLIITNVCIIFAVFFEPKVLFLSTTILAALASGLGIFIVSHCKKTKSTAEVCVMGMLTVYITFFTLIAYCSSILSITIV